MPAIMERKILILLMIEVLMTLLEQFRLAVEEALSDEEVLLYCKLLYTEILSKLVERSTPTRIENYVERVIPGQTGLQFQENFRMTPGAFEILLKYMGPQLLASNKFSPITKLMDPRKQLLGVIWLLGTPDSYRSVAERFNMGKSSLHLSFVNVVKILNSFSRNLIKWPSSEAARDMSLTFQMNANIPGVIGAIDGTYINIKAPSICPERYVHRKCGYGITLQAVCDAHLLFTDAYTGYPSSVSDRRIFINSDLYKNVIERRIIFPEGHFIIGDKAYPVLSWCIPPFIDRGRLTSHHTNFNTAHAKTRQCIERAFALLKGRFRRLKYLDMSKTDFIPSVILACCVLHNVCLLNEDIEESLVEQYIQEGRPSVIGEDEVNILTSEDDLNRVPRNETLHGEALRQSLLRHVRL